ncbi:putative C-type lectin domain family 20 member A isoform X2 [Takifugu rubripes]|uniref:putative C-type lectin domain family 20 member A isoform X2 n=1 Tax=Takifugu rubripes TaxID=31033 RepID=UPI001146005C|nr:putative C-type lectin domain family 20 member A isoform X2 [Takifugu rubripes]
MRTFSPEMGLKTGIIFLSGLCFLPACFAGNYNLVKRKMKWTDAQSHCREEFSADLGSVHSEQDLSELRNIASSVTLEKIWLGLSLDVDSWSWSLEKDDFYVNKGAEFRMWKSNQPNNHGGQQNCARMNENGLWNDAFCLNPYTFVCYNDKSPILPSFIFVNKPMSWMDAQSYCRQHYTDLASVRDKSENEQIQLISSSPQIWIGLYRGPWKWSDGSSTSFLRAKTNINETHARNRTSCGVFYKNKMRVSNCDSERFSVCQMEKRQIVRVEVSVQHSSVNLEDAAEIILQQIWPSSLLSFYVWT